MDKQKQYEIAYKDYKSGKMRYQQIADKYKVSLSAVQSWKTRHWTKMDNAHDVHNDVQLQGNQGNTMQ